MSERKERKKGCVAAKKIRKCVCVMNGNMSHYCVCVLDLRSKQEPHRAGRGESLILLGKARGKSH